MNRGLKFMKDGLTSLSRINLNTRYSNKPTKTLVDNRSGIDRINKILKASEDYGRINNLKLKNKSYAKRVIKVESAGSGNDGIREKNLKGLSKMVLDKDAIMWQKKTKFKRRLLAAGPGAPSTTGFGWYLKGLSDTGSNSISNLTPQLTEQMRKLLNEMPGNESRLLLAEAHSRGTLAALNSTKSIQNEFKDVDVELVVFDPVPGPLHYGNSQPIDVSELAESSVIYSVATQYPLGFNIKKVTGTKRLILSQQNHSGGLKEGYSFEGKRYKGSNINSLPPGCYVDANDTGEYGVELKRVDSLQEAASNMFAMYDNSKSNFGSWFRLRRIYQVAEAFFENSNNVDNSRAKLEMAKCFPDVNVSRINNHRVSNFGYRPKK